MAAEESRLPSFFLNVARALRGWEQAHLASRLVLGDFRQDLSHWAVASGGGDLNISIYSDFLTVEKRIYMVNNNSPPSTLSTVSITRG